MVHATTAAGLSEPRLARLREVMAGHVERGAVPGLVGVVARRGEVHVETLGTNDPGGSSPLARDTIFRISSLTKSRPNLRWSVATSGHSRRRLSTTDQGGCGVPRVIHFEVHASDPDALIAFYTELLDWRFVQQEAMDYRLIETGPKDGNILGLLQPDQKVA